MPECPPEPRPDAPFLSQLRASKGLRHSARAETDPTLEILDVRWCDAHALQHGGADDSLVSATAYLLGSVEAGGDDNRRWCEILHRRRVEPHAPASRG